MSKVDGSCPPVEEIQWNVGASVVMLVRVRVWHEDFLGFVGGDDRVGCVRVVCARGGRVVVQW